MSYKEIQTWREGKFKELTEATSDLNKEVIVEQREGRTWLWGLKMLENIGENLEW